jgi:hypothetical protein
MTMPEMQKQITNLRLLLANIKAKEDDLNNTRRQFQRQLNRSPGNAIRGGNTLEATLGIMEEIQERLDHVEMQQKHLRAIRKRAQDELHALQITDKIEQAKTELAMLRENDSGTAEDRAKIEELEKFIDEASLRAGQIITGDLGDIPTL